MAKFHRLVHKLADEGKLKIAGGGRQPKTIWIVPNPPGRRPSEKIQLPPEDERTVKALKLFDALCAVIPVNNAS